MMPRYAHNSALAPLILPLILLGNLSRQLPAEDARRKWPFLQRRLRETRNRGGVSAALCFTGLALFTPVEISADDWEIVLNDLAVKRER
jgi:hypothetical protein